MYTELLLESTAADRGYKDRELTSADFTMQIDKTHANRHLGKVVTRSKERVVNLG